MTSSAVAGRLLTSTLEGGGAEGEGGAKVVISIKPFSSVMIRRLQRQYCQVARAIMMKAMMAQKMPEMMGNMGKSQKLTMVGKKRIGSEI